MEQVILDHMSLPPDSRLPTSEIPSRLRALRRQMSEEAVDLLLLTGQSNLEYFSGHKSLTWLSHSRPLFLLVGADEAVLVASRAEERNVLSAERPFRSAFYQGFLADAIPVIAREARQITASSAPTVAIDYGTDMFGRGSLALSEVLEDRLKCTLIEASKLIWSIRMIKSRYEADMKRTSFRIADGAFDATMREARVGMTEIEMFRAIQAKIILNGAERADPFPVIFSSGEFVYNRWPTARRLATGDFIWADFRSTFGGYPADRNRIGKAGPLSPNEVHIYQAIRALTIELAKTVRPGMTGGNVFTRFQELWAECDLAPFYARAGRIGHGGGLDLTEPPSIMAGSTERIAEGMILHFEPKLERNGGVFQFEEAVYVGSDGNEFLTVLSPEECPIVR